MLERLGVCRSALERRDLAGAREQLAALWDELSAGGEHERWMPACCNLWGVLRELEGRRLDAQSWYRAALSFAPDDVTARRNLERTTTAGELSAPILGADEP